MEKYWRRWKKCVGVWREVRRGVGGVGRCWGVVEKCFGVLGR